MKTMSYLSKALLSLVTASALTLTGTSIASANEVGKQPTSHIETSIGVTEKTAANLYPSSPVPATEAIAPSISEDNLQVFTVVAEIPHRLLQTGNVATHSTWPEEATSNSSNRSVEPRGPRSWFIKKALGIISGMIRHGGDGFIRLAGHFLDNEAKKAIRNNSGLIADAIDTVAGLPDLAGHVVREKLMYALSDPLGPGTASVIASAVEGAIWLLL